jgi:hypothetical protein
VNGGVNAVWVWARGGGWNGPYLRSDLWLDANNYALSKLVWDPSLTPTTLALQWATLRFGPQAAPHVARVLELSEEIILRTFYVAPFARRHGAWAPNVAWTRDDLIFGADRVGALYQQAKEPPDFDEAIREKEIARRLLREMVAEMGRAADLSSDPDLADEAINTVRYGEALLSLMNDYVSGMFYYFRWVDLGRVHDNDRQAALRDLASWREGWTTFNDRILLLYGVATGYVDHGMVRAVDDAIADMNGLAVRR